MITEEIIQRTNQEREFLKIKHNLAAAIQAVDTAINYLHKTDDYESSVLDYAMSELQDVKRRLEALMEV